MSTTENLTAKTAFYGAKGYINTNKDEIAFNEFQNRMRQGNTTDWKYEYGQTTFPNKDSYIHILERELFDLLNEKTGKGGIHCG